MTLTSEDITILRRPFAVEDHEFHPYSKFTYVKERAISERLEEVDPAFDFRLIGQPTYRVGDGGKQFVIVLASLTLKGCTRESIGMEELYTVSAATDKKAEKISDKEAEKGAATDALKRGARLFGVGRYLTDLSKDDNVSDYKSLARWMAAQGLLPAQANQTNNQPTDHPLSSQIQGDGNSSKPANGAGKETRVVIIDGGVVKISKAGKPYLATTARTGEKVSLWHVLMVKRGYCLENEWITADEQVNLPNPITVRITKNGEYWDIDTDSVPPFDPVWAELGNTELPGMPEVKEDVPF